MAQEYEAVTTLLTVFGTDTKTADKKDFFHDFFSLIKIFWAHFKEIWANKIVVTSQSLGKSNNQVKIPLNLLIAEIVFAFVFVSSSLIFFIYLINF